MLMKTSFEEEGGNLTHTRKVAPLLTRRSALFCGSLFFVFGTNAKAGAKRLTAVKSGGGSHSFAIAFHLSRTH